MTRMKLMLPVLTALVFAVLAAPTYGAQTSDETTSKEVNQEVSEAIDAIKSYTIEQRDDVLRESRTIMRDLDSRIEAQEERLRQQWHQMDESAREQARAIRSSLKQKRNELAEWYGGLQHSSERAWEDIKLGFSNAFSNLEAAWEDAEREFSKEP